MIILRHNTPKRWARSAMLCVASTPWMSRNTQSDSPSRSNRRANVLVLSSLAAWWVISEQCVSPWQALPLVQQPVGHIGTNDRQLNHLMSVIRRERHKLPMAPGTSLGKERYGCRRFQQDLRMAGMPTFAA